MPLLFLPLQLLRDGRSLQQDDSERVDGIIALTIMMVFIFCVAWAPTYLRRCRRRSNNDNSISNNRLTALVDTQSQADVDMLRRMMEEGSLMTSSSRRIAGMTPEDRREYILNVLMTKHVTLAPEQPASAVDSEIPPRPELQRQKSTVILARRNNTNDDNEEDEDEENVCPICLNEYEDGDEISFSHNEKCPHFFHRECIAQWLMNFNEGCPCCRHNFLSFDDMEELPVATPITDDDEDDTVAFARGLQLFLEFASEHSFRPPLRFLPARDLEMATVTRVEPHEERRDNRSMEEEGDLEESVESSHESNQGTGRPDVENMPANAEDNDESTDEEEHAIPSNDDVSDRAVSIRINSISPGGSDNDTPLDHSG